MVDHGRQGSTVRMDGMGGDTQRRTVRLDPGLPVSDPSESRTKDETRAGQHKLIRDPGRSGTLIQVKQPIFTTTLLHTDGTELNPLPPHLGAIWNSASLEISNRKKTCHLSLLRLHRTTNKAGQSHEAQFSMDKLADQWTRS